MKNSIRLQALKDLWHRYATVWRNVWSIRDQLDPPKREEDERAFLPAHLELTETPLSAAPKWSARIIMLFALLTLLWAMVGKMDIVAVAQGKTAPSGRSKIIQPLETAVVKSINVTKGEHVVTGQTLVELSGIGSDSDYERSAQALQAAYLAKWRSETLLFALEHKTAPPVDMPLLAHAASTVIANEQNPASITAGHLNNVPADILSQAQSLVLNQYQTWYSKDQQLQAAKSAREAEQAAIRAQITKLEGLTRIEQQRTRDYKALLDKKTLGADVD